MVTLSQRTWFVTGVGCGSRSFGGPGGELRVSEVGLLKAKWAWADYTHRMESVAAVNSCEDTV